MIQTSRVGRLAVPRTVPIGAIRAESLALAGVLTLAFVLRVAWAAYSDWQPALNDDTYRYDFAARALAEGRGYIGLTGSPSAFWPPGYPLLLAAAYLLLGDSIWVAQALNIALGAATVWLIYLIGRRTLGVRPALVGASIVAAFPSLIFFTAVTLSETAFTFFALLGVYLLLRESQREEGRDRPLLLAAGLVIGFAALIRGPALLLPLAFVPFWLRSGVSWRPIAGRVAVIAAGIALIVGPWAVRNAIQLDAPVLISTNGGVDFWIGHHEGAVGHGEKADELVFSHPELSTVEREVRADADGFRQGLRWAVTHPAQEVALLGQKLFWLYHNDEQGLRWNDAHGGQPFLGDYVRQGLLNLSNGYYFAVLAFLVLGAPLWLSFRRPGPVLLISLIVYWTVVHLAFFTDPRFHAPIMPVVALLAALPWAVLWSRGDRERSGDQ